MTTYVCLACGTTASDDHTNKTDVSPPGAKHLKTCAGPTVTTTSERLVELLRRKL